MQQEKKAEAERISREQVVRGLESDETIQYIIKLEEDQRRMHGLLRESSQQLNAAKVSNAALQRRLEKVAKLKKIGLDELSKSLDMTMSGEASRGHSPLARR